MIKLVSFLLRVSPVVLVLAIAAGIISGVSYIGLLAVITSVLVKTEGWSASLFWSFVALCVMMIVSRAASTLLLTKLTLSSTLRLRMRLSHQILSAPLRRLEEMGSYRLLVTLGEDIPVITLALASIPALCMNAAIIASCLVYMGWLFWPLLLGIVCCLVVGAGVYHLVNTKAQRYVELSRDAADALMKHTRALTDGAKELKLHRRRREAFLSDHLEHSAESLRKHTMNANHIFMANSVWAQALIFATVAAILFGIPGILAVKPRVLTGYTLVILYMIAPLEQLLTMLPNLSRASVIMQKVEQLGLSLATNAVKDYSSSASPFTTAPESLELVNVTHTFYQENREGAFTLGPINLSIKGGEVVFLIGGNGSGKTTLAKLLTGLYDPESGVIRLNGVAITDQTREDYRQIFSVVFTDFFLFEELMGLQTASLESRARDYLARLQLARKVQINQGKFSTIKLSHGQRKRLALLTAYLEDRPIYVFDEWAADQDPLFKEVFYLQILPELKSRGKTVFVISHDDHYYNVADRVVKLDYGQIEYDKLGIKPIRASAERP